MLHACFFHLEVLDDTAGHVHRHPLARAVGPGVGQLHVAVARRRGEQEREQ